MRDLKRHEQARRGQDDQAQNDRFGRCRPDVADDDLDVGDGGGQDLVDRARELGEEDAERRIGDALRQQRQHDQAWHDERAVADAIDVGNARADRRPEYDEVERRRDDGRDDALQQRAKRPCHLEHVDRPDRMKVHRSSFTRLTKISSSELCLVWRSLNPMPALRQVREQGGDARVLGLRVVGVDELPYHPPRAPARSRRARLESRRACRAAASVNASCRACA